ncbi:transposase [Azospirillum brasilense]|uniref:Transposase n=1 Tax=Azospirillum brasilense TaxID=192 RepID=A0A560CI35_AZOBR|nr:IS110 family transposase [Azospirillum brasilense]TWA84525.1 transposase [Azospirillum brasilense]
MQMIVERGCALDVHLSSVVACALVGPADQPPQRHERVFGTTYRELEALRGWLKELAVTHVAMESTGVYWKPVYAVLECDFTLLVGNAQHLKQVPGRKTDRKDAAWLAELLHHGLIRPSFVPPPEIRELRDLVHYRRSLVAAQTSERNRTLKLLEGAGLKLASVVSNVFGVSGMAMLKALTTGDATPETIAALAQGRLRRKRELLTAAAEQRLGEPQRSMLGVQLRRLAAVEADIADVESRITERMERFRVQPRLLTTIPGVNELTAATIIAEIGIDMTSFGSASRLAAWAGVCPGSSESAGKKKTVATRKGNPQLKAVLVNAALSAARVGGSYFKDKYHRLKVRRGAKRAAVAIAHKLLVVAFHLLSTGEPFRELGEGFLDQQARHRTTRRLIRRLNQLGYEVQIARRAEGGPSAGLPTSVAGNLVRAP